MFITFEGGDGAGKSTQIHHLHRYLLARGREVCLTREPGGTPISERIRELLLDPKNAAMEPLTEALLYAAGRAQHVRELIRPALAQGKVVLCDRFFDSSLAYQAFGRELGTALIEQINAAAMDGLQPNRTYFLQLSPDAAMRRIKGEPDRIEQAGSAFFGRVQAGYDKIAGQNPHRVLVLDASLPPEEIAGHIRRDIDALLLGGI